MPKNSKKKFLFMTVFLLTLLSSCTIAALVPNVQAAEPTAHQKALVISNDVVGLNLAKYATVEKEVPQDAYLGVVPQENVRYVLESGGSKIDMLYTFANGKLRKIHVLETEGSPQMTKTASNALEMAKNFFSDYQAFSANSFYGELGSMLTTVDAGKNLTVTSGNTKLEVTAEEDSTTFRWTYTFNSVEAPNKCITLRYKSGFLKYFVDDWGLYKIGSTSINLSEEEAIDIAMARAKTYSWPVESTNTTIEFNVTNAMIIETIFAPSLYADTARSQDLLELFPMRHVWVSLDKFYPGNVYGIDVHVWADTKEVGRIQERFSTMDPPADLVAALDDVAVGASEGEAFAVDKVQSDSWSPTWLAFPAFAAVALAMVVVCLSRKKTLRPFNLLKPRVFKTGGVLLCVLLASTVLVELLVGTANAAPLYGRATVWGSESTGAKYDPPGWSWRKHPDEVSQQKDTASFIASQFALNGYYASDYQGSQGSSKTLILSQISNNEVNYPRVAVVDFDHGVLRDDYHDYNPQVPAGEVHYLLEDNFGTYSGPDYYHPGAPHHEHIVYDMDIAYQTTLEKTFFALINTCMSANLTWEGPILGRVQGMPYAWTHRLVRNRDTYPGFNTTYHMSDDGYLRADSGKFCYIGFEGGSAALNQTIASWPSSPSYRLWLEHFFAWALTSDMTVKNALDESSQAWFDGRDFDQTALYSGFTAMWPMYINGNWNYTLGVGSGQGWMKVYGNGDTKLYQPLLTLSASGGLSPTFTISNQQYGSQQYGTGGHRLISGDYTINVTDIPNYSFSHFSYDNNNYGRPATIQIGHDSELTAVYNWNPTNYTLSISSTGGGHTDPSGDQQYLSYTYAHVVAVPDNSNWVFDSWRLDGNNAGTNPSIYVYMDGPHTLQAIFVPPPSYYFVSSIHDYGCDGFHAGVSDPDSLIGISNDGQYATLYAEAYYDEAWIIGNMNTQATGHIKLYGSGYSNHLRVYVSNDGSNYNLVSDQDVSQGSPDWIDVGSYSGNFNYIAVDVYADGIPSDIHVDSVRVDPPANYILTISSGSGGSTTPSPGAYQYTEGTPVAVTANPNSGYVLDYWLLDGQNAGSQNPITVTMNSNHSLQANFQSSQHSLTVLAYNQYSEPGYVPLYIDSQYVGTTGYAYSVTDGNHQIYVEDPVFDGYFFHYFDHYYYDGNNDYNNPTTLSVTSDKTVTAYYNSWY